MVVGGIISCPNCGETLLHYGTVKRIVRSKCGEKYWIKIERLTCPSCKTIHRSIPSFLIPYKHYEAQIITGFVDGTITSFDLEYEDYPCETTIKDWKRNVR